MAERLMIICKAFVVESEELGISVAFEKGELVMVSEKKDGTITLFAENRKAQLPQKNYASYIKERNYAFQGRNMFQYIDDVQREEDAFRKKAELVYCPRCRVKI